MISDQYKAILKQSHELNPQWGASVAYWMPHIQPLIDKHQPADIMDFGCGKGVLKTLVDIPVYEYDPPLNKYDLMKADLLIACDVLEHVETHELGNVLITLSELYNKGYFITASYQKAKFTLSDGRNAHITLFTRDEWIDMLKVYFPNANVGYNHEAIWVYE